MMNAMVTKRSCTKRPLSEAESRVCIARQESAFLPLSLSPPRPSLSYFILLYIPEAPTSQHKLSSSNLVRETTHVAISNYRRSIEEGPSLIYIPIYLYPLPVLRGASLLLTWRFPANFSQPLLASRCSLIVSTCLLLRLSNSPIIKCTIPHGLCVCASYIPPSKYTHTHTRCALGILYTVIYLSLLYTDNPQCGRINFC